MLLVGQSGPGVLGLESSRGPKTSLNKGVSVASGTAGDSRAVQSEGPRAARWANLLAGKAPGAQRGSPIGDLDLVLRANVSCKKTGKPSRFRFGIVS